MKETGSILSVISNLIAGLRGSEIKLVKNDEYWGDKVHVDTITFKVIPESATRNADLERGFVHIADPVQPVEVDGIF